MTKRKDGNTPRKEEENVAKLEREHSESSLSKTRKKVVKRIVTIEDPTELEINIQKKAHLEHLYQTFSLKAETIDLVQLPKIPGHIKNDFLLLTLVDDFEEIHNKYLILIKNVSTRWQACHLYYGYHDDLIKLLSESLYTLSELHINLEKIYKTIIQRLDLISFNHLEPHHIKAAREQLVTSLDAVILSLLILQFNSSIYPQAERFKKQTIFIVEKIHDLLKDKDLKFDSNLIEELSVHLFAHLGIKKHILGLSSNIQVKPICLKIINPLILKLFQLKENTTSQEMEKKVLAFYDLAARLDACPIHMLKKYELLYYCKRNQEEQIISINNELNQLLNQLLSQLNDIKTVFSGKEHEYLTDIRTADALTVQINKVVAQLKVHNSNAAKYQFKDEDQLIDLIKFTHLQEDLIEQLTHMKKEAMTLSSKTQGCIKKLEEFYSLERIYLINELKDAVKQALPVLELQSEFNYSQEIEQANTLANDLLTSNLNIPLSALKTKMHYKTTRLKGYVNEFKASLKFEWATHIFDILANKSDHMLFRRDTNLSIIVRQMTLYNEPYKTSQLCPNNPFQEFLDDVNNECNHSISQLITHFSKLDKFSGQDLKSWMIRIQSLFQNVQEGLSKRSTIQKQAKIIEHRINSPGYVRCLEIINIINKTFIDLLNYHLKKMITHDTDNGLLNRIVQNPTSLLQKNKLNIEEIKLLNQLDPQLIKLLNLAKDLDQLNTVFISVHLHLCSDNNYINQLLGIIINHIDKDGKALYAQGFDNANRFIEWLHIKVYKPLLKYYTPHSALSESVDPSLDSGINPFKRTNSAFFQPPRIGPTDSSAIMSINCSK